MLKRQINAMEQVARNAFGLHAETLSRVWYTKDYVYASDGSMVFRIKNDTGKVSDSVVPYPADKMDKFFAEPDETSRDVQINDEEKGRYKGFRLCQIGVDFYNVANIRKAYAILGKNVRGWEHRFLRYRGLHVYSDEGEAFILPIRLYSESDLN